jgi:hypothetical protein
MIPPLIIGWIVCKRIAQELTDYLFPISAKREPIRAEVTIIDDGRTVKQPVDIGKSRYLLPSKNRREI